MSMEPDIELMIDEDKVLWDSISRGDKKAFNDFFMKYYTLLYEYSRYYVSAEDAKEVLQELMMWLWENRVTFVLGTTSSLRQYLITSVRHRCLNVLRKQKRKYLKNHRGLSKSRILFMSLLIYPLSTNCNHSFKRLLMNYRLPTVRLSLCTAFKTKPVKK
ncbi:hypothetical protein NXW16_04675 [Bacteroides thetaiotaomicron]|nr:hypothetical protein [Bacteroides thetaiotaomicron]